MSPLHSRGSPIPSAGNKMRSGCFTPALLGAQKRAEMLRHPCILAGPQRQARGTKSEVVASPLPYWGPKRGWKCNVTPALGDPQQRGAKSEVVASPLPSRGPKRGRKCYVTPAFLGVPNAKRGEQNQKWLPHACLLGGPKECGKCYVTPAFSGVRKAKCGEQNQKWLPHPCLFGGQKEGGNATSPLRSGIPNKGEQNQKWLPHLCLLGGPKEGGNATSPLHARGSPKPSAGNKIRSGYLTLAFSGVCNAKCGEQKQKWMPHPCLLGGPKKGGNATSPFHSQGSPTPSAGNKIRSGCLTSAFSGAQKRAEMLRHPCMLGGPRSQARGTKSEVATSPLLSRGSPTPSAGNKSRSGCLTLPSRGPKKRRKCYVTLAFAGVPNTKRGEQNRKWLPHPCLLGGPIKGGNATFPLHYRGSPTPSAGNKIRIGCSTPAFSGAQNRAKVLRQPCILEDPRPSGGKSEVAALALPSQKPKRGRKCYATPAFSGIPNAKREEQNRKWLPHLALSGAQKRGGNAMSPLHSRGSPTPSAGNKMRSGCFTPALLGAQKRAGMLCHPCILGGPQRQARGTKSKVAASPLPYWGPKRGRKCYAALAFWGVPNKGEQSEKWLPTPAFSGAQKRAEMLRHPCILGDPQRQARGTKS